MPSKIYIIDDDPQMGELLGDYFEASEYEVHIFTSAKSFLDLTITQQDIILLDLNMPDIDGIEVIRLMAENTCHGHIIFISGNDKSILIAAEKLAQAQSLNVAGHFSKPIRLPDLENAINKIDLKVQSKPSPTSQTPPHDSSSPTVYELDKAIVSGEIILYYQPQICLKTGNLIGVEALARWPSEGKGMIPPGIFISLAEKHGLIDQLTTSVIKQVIEQSSFWKQQGHNIHISVNLSAENITSLTSPEVLIESLKSHNVDPSSLTLEITESSLMNELVTSLDILTRLRLKGFNLSIDDFGTGYSSLSQLHKIPFTELKIDQSFIIPMENDNDARAITKTCVILGHELNMKVVAEGVETQHHLDTLIEYGCDIAQGYFIARPMPAEKLLDWKIQNTPINLNTSKIKSL